MKITAINGSPKGNRSSTAIMLDALLEGFKNNGDTIQTMNLSEKKIGQCLGCYSCWTKTPGICVQNDDMLEIRDSLDGSDIIVFGTPLYFNNLSGMLKTFIDRLTASGGDPHNKVRAKGKNPKYIMASNCGFLMREQFDVISLWIKHFSQLVQAPLIGEFYMTNGKILRSPDSHQEKPRANYLEYLKECGNEISTHGNLSERNRNKLKQTIMEF